MEGREENTHTPTPLLLPTCTYPSERGRGRGKHQSQPIPTPHPCLSGLESIANATDNGPLAQYAGTEIALYFEWLQYYTKCVVSRAFPLPGNV